MAYPPPKLPRRHAQRQSLSYSQNKTSPPSPPNCEHLRSYKSRAKKEERLCTPSDDDNDDSDSGSGFDSDSDSEYNSTVDPNAKAEYYQQKRVEFMAAGPALSNLSENAKQEVLAEERKWEL